MCMGDMKKREEEGKRDSKRESDRQGQSNDVNVYWVGVGVEDGKQRRDF